MNRGEQALDEAIFHISGAVKSLSDYRKLIPAAAETVQPLMRELNEIGDAVHGLCEEEPASEIVDADAPGSRVDE